ncbi:MAG TPA: hypothetical protein VGR00_06900 [Thermoanaerobaculia bacterium]|nr:hypothetical protein [Thermoanaerobaculia bacterium]
MGRARTALLFAVAVVAGMSHAASACSICRCGDATFNSLGMDVFSSGSFRFAVDWERFDKENALSEEHGVRRRRLLHEEEPGKDAEVENRFTATLSYTFGETATAVVRLPWSKRRLTTTTFDEEQVPSASTSSSSDLSDPEIYALVRLYSTPFEPGLGRRTSLSAMAGVKTPWGRNDLREGGERLDEHLQAGTGATDVYGGLSAVYLLDPRSAIFGSALYRRTGTNAYEYKFGDVTTASLSYERKLGGIVDSVLSLDYRHASRDRVDASGTLDENTGGDVVYVGPRILLDLGSGLVARAAAQIPVAQSLYGDQTERAVLNVGLTYVFR